MNYLLLLLDHPPVIIHAEDRRAYYNALEQFDSDQKLDSLVDFLKSQTVKTWQTVNYARRKQLPITLIHPDSAAITYENQG